MSRFKKGIVEDIRKEKGFEQAQERLKDKYSIADENVIVVEKTNVYKFTVKLLIAGVRLAASAALLILAAIGLLTIIYPETRSALYHVWSDIYKQITVFLPFM